MVPSGAPGLPPLISSHVSWMGEWRVQVIAVYSNSTMTLCGMVSYYVYGSIFCVPSTLRDDSLFV